MYTQQKPDGNHPRRRASDRPFPGSARAGYWQRIAAALALLNPNKEIPAMSTSPTPAPVARAPRHDFIADHSTAHYTIKVSPATRYGYFEHVTLGDARGGGLWFEPQATRLALVDYDGVPVLPLAVCESLHAAGYRVEPVFWPNPSKAPAPHGGPAATDTDAAA